MQLKELNKLQSILSTKKKIIITTHRGPDGDAIGSSLALYNYLLKKGHHVNVITPNDYPDFLHWMHRDEEVIQFESNPHLAEKLTLDSDIVFCLDFNELSRIDGLEPLVRNTSALKVLIDHHQDPSDFDIVFSDPSASSTSELIFELIDDLGDRDSIDHNIAECLYVGIMTDTGSFRFPSVKPKTHEIVSELLKKGVVHNKVYDLIYDNNSETRLHLLGYCLQEKLEVILNLKTAIISLTNEELNRFKYQKGDTEGIVNYALSIKGIVLAAFLVERDGMIKISFRSKGNVAVNKLAQKYFNGGGHINAAGGSFSSMSQAIKQLKNVVPNFIITK